MLEIYWNRYLFLTQSVTQKKNLIIYVRFISLNVIRLIFTMLHVFNQTEFRLAQKRTEIFMYNHYEFTFQQLGCNIKFNRQCLAYKNKIILETSNQLGSQRSKLLNKNLEFVNTRKNGILNFIRQNGTNGISFG